MARRDNAERATGTATAALAEFQPHGDRQAAAMMATGTNMTGLGLGPLIAGFFAAYVASPTSSVFWVSGGSPWGSSSAAA